MRHTPLIIIILLLFCPSCKLPWAKENAIEYMCSLQKILNLVSKDFDNNLHEMQSLGDSIPRKEKLDSLIQMDKESVENIQKAIEQMKGIEDINDQIQIREHYITYLGELDTILEIDILRIYQKAGQHKSVVAEQLDILNKCEFIKEKSQKVEQAFNAEYGINKYDIKSINTCANNDN